MNVVEYGVVHPVAGSLKEADEASCNSYLA